MNLWLERIKPLFDDLGMKPKDIARAVGCSVRDVYHWNTDGSQSYTKYFYQFSKVLNVSVAYLMGETDEREPLSSPTVAEDVVSFPVLGEVAAGFDRIAYTDWEGDKVDIPASYLKGRPASDYFVLRVVGSSMYPTYQDGDKVLVLRQSTMDRPGQIGVVMYNDDAGTLKRVDYGDGWIKLSPVNPSYEPVRISGEALEHCHVLGVPKMVIREIID